MQRQSLYEKISNFSWKCVNTVMGFGSSLPNVQYAMSVTGNAAPNAVNAQWLVSLSTAPMIASFYSGTCTFLVSGFFGYRFFEMGILKFKEEFNLFCQRKNTKRFLIETTMTILAAIVGGSIAGGPYTGALKWGARFIGFSTVFSLSFLGIHELIIKLTDENYALKLKIIDQLKNLNPRYRAQVEELLQGKELTIDTFHEFLDELLTLSEKIKNEPLQAEQKENQPLFLEKTKQARQKEQIRNIGDFGISAILTGCCTFIYTQGGFEGSNFTSGNQLDDISDVAKILIGFSTALPLALFVFFTMKILNSPILDLLPGIKKDPKAVPKSIALIGLNAGNALWYTGLAKMLAENKNIFLGALDNSFGKVLAPGAAYLTCFMLGMNGLIPMLFPSSIKIHDPDLNDVINVVKYRFKLAEIEGLKTHCLFNQRNRLPKEAMDLKEIKEVRDEPIIIHVRTPMERG